MAEKSTAKADGLRAMREARYAANKVRPAPPDIAAVEKAVAKKTARKKSTKKENPQ